jgi:hypothetical protein
MKQPYPVLSIKLFEGFLIFEGIWRTQFGEFTSLSGSRFSHLVKISSEAIDMLSHLNYPISSHLSKYRTVPKWHIQIVAGLVMYHKGLIVAEAKSIGSPTVLPNPAHVILCNNSIPERATKLIKQAKMRIALG